MLDPCLLKRMQGPVITGQTFDGGNLAAGCRGRQNRAGANRAAIKMHGAGSAKPPTAAKFGAYETETIAQHPQQWGQRFDPFNRVLLTIDG